MNNHYAHQDIRIPIRCETSAGVAITGLTVTNLLVDFADETILTAGAFQSLTKTTHFTLEEMGLGQYWLKVKYLTSSPAYGNISPGLNFQIQVRGDTCPTIVTKNYSGHVNKHGTFVLDGIKNYLSDALRIPARFEDGTGVGITGLTHSAGYDVKFAFESDTVYDVLASTSEWTLEELSNGDYFIIINSSLITKAENWTAFVEVSGTCPTLNGPTRQKYSGYVDTKFKSGFVTYDPQEGSAGTVYPLGEPNTPVSSFANAETIANAANIRKILILGDVPSGASVLDDFELLGGAGDTVTVMPKFSMSGSKRTVGAIFRNLRIIDSQTDTGFDRFFENCIIDSLTALDIGGVEGDLFKDCSFLKAGNYDGNGGVMLAQFDNCYFLDMTVLTDASIVLNNCRGKFQVNDTAITIQNSFINGFVGDLVFLKLFTGTTWTLRGVEGTIDLQSGLTLAATTRIQPGNYNLIDNSGALHVVTEELPTNIIPQLAKQDIFETFRSGIVAGSYLDFLYPIIADAFNEADDATSQVFTALAANTSFETGQEFAIIFTDLESGTADTKRHGSEFMGAYIIDQQNSDNKKVWQIIGGYRMNNDGTPVIVTATKFGVCFSMADLDLFSIPVSSPRWSGADPDGEENRTEAGWTFVVKQARKTDGAIATFPTSGDDLQIRSLTGGFLRETPSAGGGDATLANQNTILGRIGTPSVSLDADHSTILSRIGVPTVSLTADIAALPAANADAVWDEAKTDHVASGSFGEEMQFFFSAIGLGKSTMQNDAGDGQRIKRKFYNYAETSVIRTIQILKPDETDNTATLDTNAMAGTET